MTLEPQLKLAVLEDNRFLFGDAEMRLLDAIGRGGTLTDAATALGLSYRVAWGKLRDLEAAVGARLVQKSVGGRHGGSSRLTDAGRHLVDRYRRFRDTVGTFALAEFEKCFGEAPDCSKLVSSPPPSRDAPRQEASAAGDST
jgi:molybdate transport system regulatory protein